MTPLSRRQRLALLAILTVALALRLGAMLSQRGDILFEHPILDEQRYVDGARALTDGRLAEDRPYWQPPGILFALAAVMKVAGPGLTAPRVVQALFSTAACLLLFAIARRLFGVRTALASAAILALHGVVIFESNELLPPTFILFFDLAAIVLLLIAAERKTAPLAFGAGLALGVSALFSPTVLPFVAVAALVLRRATLIGALLAGVLLPIAPVTWRNYQHGRELVLVSTNGGLNFYLGNNADYPSTFALRPGRRWEVLATEAQRQGLAPGAASAYYFDKGLSFYRQHPAGALGLYARKLYLFFNGAEIPRDSDLYQARHGSPVLTALVWPRWFPDGVLIPLGLAGALLLWRDRKRLGVVYAFFALQAILVPAFFVTARHRVPALALFALFAAAGAAELRRRPRFLLVVAALAVALNLPTREAGLSWGAEQDFYRGLALQRELHDPAAAVVWFGKAAAADPADARYAFELGNALEAAGRPDQAIDAWRRAAQADPWDVRPLRFVSRLLTQRGDLDGAIAALQRNVDARQREPAVYASDWLNLAFLRGRTGQIDRAVEALRAAAQADPIYFRQHAPSLPRDAIAEPRFWQALDELER